MATRHGLTEKEQMFLLEYVNDPDRDGPAAALRAGYAPQVAASQAARILKKKGVQEMVTQQVDLALERAGIEVQSVIEGIKDSIKIARAAGVGAWQVQAIQRGYEMLGRYLSMFTDKVEVGLDDKIMEQLLAGRRRAAGLDDEDGGKSPQALPGGDKSIN